MRFSSSALRRVALLLASTLCAEFAAPAAQAAAEELPEPCLLLRFAAPEVPDDAARGWTADFPPNLGEILRVRWVAHPEFSGAAPGGDAPEALPAPEALARIAERHDRAKALIGRLETAEAARLLDAAGGDAAKLLASEAGADLLAGILVTKAVLLAGEGDGRGAEEALAKARALRPAFVPDPATYSPRFFEAWAAACRRSPAPAELLVRSVPSGAEIAIDGRKAGTSPAAVPVRHDGVIRVRAERAGFVPAERSVRCLPGETTTLELPLRPDRRAALGLALAAPSGAGEAARLLSSAIEEAGASRAAVIVVREIEGKPALDILSFRRGGGDARVLGRVAWDGGRDGAKEAALRTGRMLVAAGWPPSPEFGRQVGSPWYYRWWFWGLVGVAVTGVAIAVSGGGSGGGSGGSGSTGSVDVTF